MKKNNKTLNPVGVSQICPVVSHSCRGEKVKGFSLVVVYDGCARLDKNRESGMGVLSGGFGAQWLFVDYDTMTQKTKVGYFFKNGLFFPEPLKSANEFHTMVIELIKKQYENIK